MTTGASNPAMGAGRIAPSKCVEMASSTLVKIVMTERNEDGDCCSATCSFETGPCAGDDNCLEGSVCSAGECVGSLIAPWFNEIDYDSNQGGITDREEFIELAGPAGLDLGGYTLYGVEGTGANCQTPGPGLLSGPILAGYPHWSYTISAEHDSARRTRVRGSASSWSAIRQARIWCRRTVIVIWCSPAFSVESTFKNGQLLNEPGICPDGMLLVDSAQGYVDAVSYEGLVLNAGPLGAYFHVNPIYNAGADEGWKPYTSLEKWTNTLGRATSGGDWRDSGGCSDQCTAGRGCSSIVTGSPGWTRVSVGTRPRVRSIAAARSTTVRVCSAATVS